MNTRSIGSLVLLTLGLVVGCGDSSTDDGNPGGTGAQGGGGVGGMGGVGAGGDGATGGMGGATGGMGGATGGMGGGGMGGGGGVIEGNPAVLVSQGDPTKVLLLGQIITPTSSFAGELLIEGELITCVAASCAGQPGAATASVVQTNGIIMPGMIDTHNHILFNIMDEDDWVPSMSYTNHNDWPDEPRYQAMLDTKQYLNGESSPVNVNCEMEKYGELKALVAGTTSIVTGANPGNKTCYRTLARTIDQSANGLCGVDPPASCPDEIQVATLFPTTSAANGVCANFGDGDTNAYIIHIGEGTDSDARDELEDLRTVTTVDGCLHDPRTLIVHGTAFLEPQFDILAANGMGLSWSPRSNVFLYGGGTDLSQTTNVPMALAKGIQVAISPDWSMGGSQNLLDELRFANLVDDTEWGDILDAQALTAMVTSIPAQLIAVDDNIGTLEVGKFADVVVIGGDAAQPYASVLDATPARVRMVYVGGKLLYGDPQLEPIAPASPGCEAIDICTAPKFLCVATNGGDATNKFGQTYSDITTNLNTELVNYDNLNLSQWDFAPIAPLVKCP